MGVALVMSHAVVLVKRHLTWVGRRAIEGHFREPETRVNRLASSATARSPSKLGANGVGEQEGERNVTLHASLSGWLVASAVLVVVMTSTPALAQALTADACRELVLHNGKIATLDARNTMASSVTIRHGRIAAVGTARGIPRHSACATVVDLRSPASRSAR